MAVQKKQIVIPPAQGPLSGTTVNRDNQKKRTGYRKLGDEANTCKPTSQNRKPLCFPSTQHASSTNSAGNTAGNHQLNVDDRLRLAKERREEREKQLVLKELSWLEREERARRYYVKQLEERKMRLLEQRMKEEKRRSAVEEKRKLKLKAEQERCESSVRRTLEKSKRVMQNLGQISRGRKLTKSNAWEKNLISRLLTPTCSYLARSKSAVCQSGQEVSCYSMNSTTNTTLKAQNNVGPANHRTGSLPSPSNNSHRGNNLVQVERKGGRQHEVDYKTWKSRSSPTPTVNTRGRPAPKAQNQTVSPSPKQNSKRSVRRHSIPKQLELASVPEEEDTCDLTLSPGNSRPIRTPVETVCPSEEMKENLPVTLHPKTTHPEIEPADRSESERNTGRPSAGTTDPEEASRILAEKRRVARLLREKQVEERLQKEEAEKLRQEELQRRRATEQAQIEIEREEKKRREEEVQKHAEEEKARMAMEEAIVLQKQREEEQAIQREKEDQMKQERDKLFQKEKAARQERKQRLEEIMRRTRKPEAADEKSSTMINSGMEVHPKENTQPLQTNTIEMGIKLPVGAKSSQLGFNGVEDMVPVVAFKERRSLRTLAGLEEIQTNQRAEVI